MINVQIMVANPSSNSEENNYRPPPLRPSHFYPMLSTIFAWIGLSLILFGAYTYFWGWFSLVDHLMRSKVEIVDSKVAHDEKAVIEKNDTGVKDYPTRAGENFIRVLMCFVCFVVMIAEVCTTVVLSKYIVKWYARKTKAHFDRVSDYTLITGSAWIVAGLCIYFSAYFLTFLHFAVQLSSAHLAATGTQEEVFSDIDTDSDDSYSDDSSEQIDDTDDSDYDDVNTNYSDLYDSSSIDSSEWDESSETELEMDDDVDIIHVGRPIL